jgi:hypothetical protein
VVYDAKCDLHHKQVAIISGGNSDHVEEIEREIFIIEPVQES